MSKEFKFRTVLSTLKKGEKPCYRALIVANGTINEKELYRNTAERVGMAPETVKYVAELLFGEIAKQAADGINVNIADGFGTSLSIRGTFDSANAEFEKGKHSLHLNINPKGALANACADATGVNVTEGARCRVTSLMDGTLREEGVISSGEDVVVYAAGATFLIDTEADDEGVWIEDEEGHIVAFATVDESTSTTLTCTFAATPEPGDYYFVVATRGGLGSEYGVSCGRYKVVVK